MRTFGTTALRTLLIVAATALTATAVHAAVPATSVAVGAITSASGQPAADGNYTATLAIYPVEQGGTALWTEAGATLAVKGGQFSYVLGQKTPLTPAVVNGTSLWLGVTIGTDPELPRRPIGSTLVALRAAVADAVECSGCIKAGALEGSVLQPFAKSADLAAYAKSADLGEYVKASALAPVSATGDYNDLANKPKLADVALTGAYGDLTGKPASPKLGAACGTGLILQGYKTDGSLDCRALVEGDLPGDGLDEVSNGLLSNQFVDTFAGTKDVVILDGISAGTSDSLIFPDIGLAQKLWVQVDLTNSDISKMRIELFAPGMATPYILYDQSEKGTALSHKYNQDTPLASGDLNKDWQGKNLAGAWSLVVKDFSKNQSGANDGKYNWSIAIQTLSNKKIQAKGNLLVAGNVAATGSVGVGNDTSTCTAANLGALRFDPKWGLQACQKDIGSTVEYAWKAAKAAPILWSGGCKSHNQNSGWNTYCLDGLDFSNADEYLTVNANGTVTMKHSGYYYINFYAIQHGCGQQDINIVVNGTGRTYTHTINDSSSSQWMQHAANLKYPFKKGDTFYVQLYHAGCGNTYDWHSWNANGAHSRLAIEYLGPLEN